MIRVRVMVRVMVMVRVIVRVIVTIIVTVRVRAIASQFVFRLKLMLMKDVDGATLMLVRFLQAGETLHTVSRSGAKCSV